MDRSGWVITPAREHPFCKLPRRGKLLKRLSVEKSKKRLFHLAWKSRKQRGIPTFQQLRRRRAYKPNRTFHVLRKSGHFTCYKHSAHRLGSRIPFSHGTGRAPVSSARS